MGAADPELQASALEAPGPALATEIHDPATMRPWLEVVYFVVSSILLLRLTVGIALSLRLLGKATPVSLDWAANAHIRISRDVAAPVTVANVILLPADAVDWPPSMRRAVLAHEHAHVARWDFAMLLLSQVNRVVFWFSPLSWWLHRRLAALAELASDDHAMEVTGDRPGYAEVLLDMGRRSGPVLRGLAMARPATLRYRIERVLSDRVWSNPVSPLQQMILAIGAVGLSIAAASSEFNSAPSSDVTAQTEQQKPPAPPDAMPSLAAEALPEPMPLPPQPRAEMASRALHRAGASGPSDLPTAIAPSRSVVRVVARPRLNPVARNSPATQPLRVTRRLNQTTNGQVTLPASLGAKPVNSVGTLPDSVVDLDPANSSNAAADEHRRAPASHPVGYLSGRERPVLRLINNRTCTGVYMPEHAAAFVNGGLNLVRAKLFRNASGTSFLTFFSGGQTPVVQPVTVTHGEDQLTASPDTVFTMLPKGARYLNGIIKPPRCLGWVATGPLVPRRCLSHLSAFLGSAERGRFFVPA